MKNHFTNGLQLGETEVRATHQTAATFIQIKIDEGLNEGAEMATERGRH